MSRARSRALTSSLALGALLWPAGWAAGQDVTPPPPRPKIGVVLSGGGARGAAHVGVLAVLEELRIPIDAIAGNSMGALVGGIYATGYSPAEMKAVMAEIDWAQVLSDRPPREERSFRRKQDDLTFLIDTSFGVRGFQFVLPKGLMAGHHSGNLLKFLVPESFLVTDFDDLRIPYRAVATDITNGDHVVLSSGSLPESMAASMAIPGVFAPVVIDGRELVDGMVVNNTPVELVRQMGVDVVIAIDIGTPLLKAEQIRSLFDVTQQMVGILMQKNVDAQLALLNEADTLIQPDLGDISSMSFERTADAIRIGEEAARAISDRLRRYSVSEAEYAQFLARQRRPPTRYPIIDRIVIENDSALGDGAILGLMDTAPGEPLDPERLQQDIERIFGLDEFERVTFALRGTAPGRADLVLRAVAKSWGPSYMRFGLALTDEFGGSAAFNVGARYTLRTINSLGAEWRNDVQIGEVSRVVTEFYQPLDPTARLFVAPEAEYDRVPANAYVNGTKVAEFDVDFGQVGADVGAHLGNWAELRFGIRRSAGEVHPELSVVPIPSFKFDDGYLRASLAVDTLDDVNFPHRGVVLGVVWSSAQAELGADIEYERLDAALGWAITFDRNTFGISTDFGTALDGTLPIYRLESRGGFGSLSGFLPNELTGQHAATLALYAYRRIAGNPLATFGMPVYLGGSLETGAVTAQRNELLSSLILAGSVFVGADTPVGPVYLGYGMAEEGNTAAFLFVGRPF